MIIVKLQGGLGNQLFQYALGRNLAYKNNVELKLDISWYATQTLREYELKYFNIQESIATNGEIQRFKRYQRKGRKIWFLYNLLIADESIYIREKGYVFSQEILNIKNNVYLDGIWQTEKYFLNIANIIKNEFTLKAPFQHNLDQTIKAMSDFESVSLCIRRDDFANNTKVNTVHGLLPMEFYLRAVKIMAEKIKKPTFFVFSDDIEWVKNNFNINFPTYFISDNHKTISSSEELILMSLCKHNINANSTFSWWASWLNNNSNKIIIAPQRWFKMESRNTSDLVPDSWLKIPNTHI